MLKTVTQYLDQSANAYPDKISFRDHQRGITFSELSDSAKALACIIYENTNGKTRQPIGVYLPKNTNSIVSFFAAAYCGNFYAPLDIGMPSIRLAKILDVLQPVVIITDSVNFESIAKHNIDSKIINIDLIEVSVSKKALDLVDVIQKHLVDTDPLYIMFTSGSTGTPKGVVISHRSVIDYTEWLSETFCFSEKTVFGNQAPFYFDNSILDIYSTVKNACETIIIPEELFLSAKRLCCFLNESKINTIFWVPSALVLVANAGVLSGEKCPTTLEKILFCGEVMPTKQLNIWRRAIPAAIYVNLYGPTEITDVCTYYIVNREFKDDEALPIGNSCNNIDILVLNENNQLSESGEIGELCIRGSCLAQGYYKDWQKTNDAFCQNPLNNNYPEKIYRTGDLVRYNEKGELLFAGRKDYQIKHMGHRIELGEIEMISSSFDSVEQSCAIYDGEKQMIILFVSPESVDKKELYSYLKARVPRYMLPGLIYAEQYLQLNSNCKIDRLKLKGKL